MRYILTSDPTPVQAIVAVAFAVMGGTLLLPGESLAHSTSWSLVASVFSENAIGAFLFITGIFIMGALLTGGPVMQMYSMLLAALIFTALTIAFVITLLSTTTVYSVFAGASLWAYWRLLTRYLRTRNRK